MIIEFKIAYKAAYGESLCVVGNLPELGRWNEAQCLPMNCVDESHWQAETEVEHGDSLEYVYLLRKGDRVLRKEWGNPRKLVLKQGTDFCLNDSWHDAPAQKFLYTSFFSENFSAPLDVVPESDWYRHTLLFMVSCPYAQRGQALVMLGDLDLLGEWNVERAVRLRQHTHAVWSVMLDAAEIKQAVQYKFALIDGTTNRIVHWEEGNNRILFPLEKGENLRLVQVYDLAYRREWMNWKAAGVAIPVFSLRTEESSGIGEFSDLKKMVDWAKSTGMKLIQVLPVNDTTITHTWTDSYPYNAISIYALHPVYLSLRDFPLKNKKRLAEFRRRAADLNALPACDYEKVLELKEAYITALYEETGAEALTSDAFACFKEKNDWLFSYACFCYLRDKYHSPDPQAWKAHRLYNKKTLERSIKKDGEMKRSVERSCFVQYLLHAQLSGVKEYARLNGVALKGDVPIGISRGSVEAWVEPHLFNLDMQTGAPPDDFSVSGQNWGFPTYNWKNMAKDGYQWWIKRFRKMSDYFDAFRIDHILGFFRIWEIPQHSVQGLLGYFSPALPLTMEEIHAWRLSFDERRMVKPYIKESYLANVFGEYAGEVAEKYLNRMSLELFELKEFCDTQLKIRDFFAGKEDDKSNMLRAGLYGLCNEVLFVRDGQEPNRFHPRIAAWQTKSYADLDDDDKSAFNRLYEHFFYERHNAFWAEQAMQKLPALTVATGMLACGEDLGMIPACVPEVMRKFQILSLEIERMPKQYNRIFEDLKTIPYLSVCTTSTHDMSPVRLWWTEDRRLTQQYYSEVLGREGYAPDECTPDICRQIVVNHLHSNAMLAILPFQDWLAIDGNIRRPNPHEECINIPAVSNHYWQYRIHLTLETLLEAAELNTNMKNMLNESGRQVEVR